MCGVWERDGENVASLEEGGKIEADVVGGARRRPPGGRAVKMLRLVV